MLNEKGNISILNEVCSSFLETKMSYFRYWFNLYIHWPYFSIKNNGVWDGSVPALVCH